MGDEVLDDVRFGGFLAIDIDARALHLAAVQGVQQGLVVYDAAAGGIDEDHPVLHPGEFLFPDQVAGIIGLGDMEGDDVGGRDYFIQWKQGECRGPWPFFPIHRGRMPITSHSNACSRETTRPPTLLRPMTPATLPLSSQPDQGGTFPFAPLEACVCLGDIAAQGEKQRQGMLGNAVGVAEGRVEDDNALFTGDFHIHAVDADACPGHQFQLLARFEYIPVDFCGAPGNNCFIIANDGRSVPLC